MAAAVVSDLAKEIARRALYTLSPSAWTKRELKLVLDLWQAHLIDAPAGKRVIPLTHRQAGKTTGAAIGIAHTMLWRKPASTSLVLAPTLRQSSELIRNLRGHLMTAGQKLAVDNTFSVELMNGSRCLAMPGSDDASIRGLAIDGDLVVDEGARVTDALYEAAQPMLIRHVQTARLILLSTAWARQGFFYRIWSEGDPHDWLKIEATVDECRHISMSDLERERRSMSPSSFAREYMNTFDSIESRFFTPEMVTAMFGGAPVPAPPPEDDDLDHAVSRSPAFPSSPFRGADDGWRGLSSSRGAR
jgi:hypothetical protein